MKITPHPYQLRGVQGIMRRGDRVLLADEMGLGKTLQALLWRGTFDGERAVIVCPASLKFNWEREAAGVGIQSKVIEGASPGRRVFVFGSLWQNVIINYDILQGWLELLLALKPSIVVLDEVHYIKNRTTLRNKLVRKLCANVPHVLALSGTPITNRPAELWPVLNLLRPDLYPAFFPFAQRYCAPKRTPWGWDFRGAVRLDELHGNLKSTMMIRRLKRNVLKELPPKSRHVVPLAIDRRNEYDEAVHNFLVWLGRQSAAKAKRAAKAEKITQLGYLKRLAATLKIEYVFGWIDSFLTESDEKLVVFGIHRTILQRIQTRFGHDSVLVDGSVSSRRRHEFVARFQRDPKTRLFVGNVNAAGVGLTLTASSTVAFVEFPWTPGEVTQAEDRIHRIGQTSHASIYYLVARDTIEDHLCRILQHKQQVLSAVLDGRRGDSLDVFDALTNTLKGNPSCPRKKKHRPQLW